MTRERRRFPPSEASAWVRLSEQSVRNKPDGPAEGGITGKVGRTEGMRHVSPDPYGGIRDGIDLGDISD